MTLDNKIKPEGGLLQSKYWACIWEEEKKEVLRIKKQDLEVFGVFQYVKFVGKYVYIPRIRDEQIELIDEIKKEAKKNNCSWVRIDFFDKKQLDKLDKSKWKKAPHDMQPKDNFIIKIADTEEEILKNMKSKTRYNVRLAIKKGVKIKVFRYKQAGFNEAFCEFFEMVEKTAKRKGVSFHPREHYESMFKKIPKENIALYSAQVNGSFVAANIITFFGGVATYLHGATSDKYRNYMAPFLLQFRAICDAKELGYNYYDFGGVFLKSNDKGKIGITKFKRGFSPDQEISSFMGSWDLVLNPFRYKVYRILLSIIKKIRK